MKNKRKTGHRSEDHRVRSLDDLADYEAFCQKVMPILRQAVSEGWSAEKIWENPKLQALLAANAVRIGMDLRDPGKALDAIRTVIYQTKGKPTEKREVVHKVEKLKDEELKSLIETHMSELGLTLDDTDLLN